MAKTKANNEEPLEKQLWKAADKLRKNIDAAEYKHVVLGLMFLKYISDAFGELHDRLKAGEGDLAGAERAKAAAIKAYDEAIDIQNKVIESALPDGGPTRAP